MSTDEAKAYYSTFLSEYWNKIENLSEDEKRQYFRVDYTERGQEYPDYLDYQDEWRWSYAQKCDEVITDFIFRGLAKNHQKLKCSDHYHIFVADDRNDKMPRFELQSENTTIVRVYPDMAIAETTCWRRHIIDRINSMTSYEKYRKSIGELSNPRKVCFEDLVAMRLATSDVSPRLLPYNVFIEIWLGRDPAVVSRQLLENEFIDVATITKLQKTSKSFPPLETTGRGVNVLVNDNHRIVRDHGFHLYIRASDNPMVALQAVNDIRKMAADYVSPIEQRDIYEHIEGCIMCKKNKDFPVRYSQFGIYYAPPGSGKTTCQANNTLVGYDTDWGLLSMNYKIAEYMMKHRIPIITNQFTSFMNSGIKTVGMFNSDILRLNDEGQPFTKLEEVKSAEVIAGTDLVIIKHFKDARKVANCGRFLEDNLIHLLFFNYVQMIINERFIYRSDKAAVRYGRNYALQGKVSYVRECFKHPSAWRSLKKKMKRDF